MSKIVITFNNPMAAGDALSFQYRDVAGINKWITCGSQWAAVKYASGQVQMTDVIPYTGLLSAMDYVLAFGIDYNPTNNKKFNVTRNGTVVTIEAINEGIEFQSFTSDEPGVVGVITNDSYTPPFSIESVEFLQATDQCGNIKIRVTTSEATTIVTSPVSLTPNFNVFDFDYARGTTFTLICGDGTSLDSQVVVTPTVLESPEVKVIDKPTGAVIMLSNYNNNDLTLEYSLDGTNYQGPSLFQGVLQGNYTAYVRDQYGCVKTTAFMVDEYVPQTDVLIPYFKIPKCNSIRFKRSESWDHKIIYKNEENTLSFEEDKLLNGIVRPYVQRWQTNDTVTVQFKSNYDTHSVNIVDTDGSTAVPVTKKSNNIRLKDSRDARIFKYVNSDGFDKTAIYFLAGNIYDYDTQQVTGTYGLNSDLPEWAVIGRSVYIEELSDYLVIEDIRFDTSVNTKIIIFASGYSGIVKDTIVSTLYNLFNWDVFEFSISMALYQDKAFQVTLDATHATFDARSFISEIQYILETQPGTIEVRTSNSENNEIIYSTGIEHLIRLEYSSFKIANESETDVHKTDSAVVSLEDNLYDKRELTLESLSTAMALAVQQLFSLDNIKLNGQQFVKDSMESPEQLGNTNMHRIKTVLYKVSETDTGTYSDVGITIPEIPQAPSLIDFGGGFLSVK